MISAAIFDLDGTLVDSNDLHVQAWQETFRHFGKEIPTSRLREQIGKGGDHYLLVFLNEKEMREIGKQVAARGVSCLVGEKVRGHLDFVSAQS